jgi:hypothetical protein
MNFRKFAAIGVSAMALSAFAQSAHANLVVNGSFETANVTTGSADHNQFGGNVFGWSGGFAGITQIDSPGQADAGGYLAVYGPFPATSPDGGNFVQADGDPSYADTIFQTLTGLTAGASYTVSFLQAAGQQLNFTGPTTEQWKVGFDGDYQLSSLFSLPQGGVGPWQAQSMTFIAAGTSAVLSFLAVGTPGGAPPISFLDGVSVEASTAVPEPAALSILGVGIVALGAVGLRRRAGKSTAA